MTKDERIAELERQLSEEPLTWHDWLISRPPVGLNVLWVQGTGKMRHSVTLGRMTNSADNPSIRCSFGNSLYPPQPGLTNPQEWLMWATFNLPEVIADG